jgi:DNA-binding CsgD family transcriptional regulator
LHWDVDFKNFARAAACETNSGAFKLDEDLIDRIYEAAALPDLWPAVLDALNDVGEGYATFLFTATNHHMAWVGSRRGAYAHDYVAEGWPAKTDRAVRLVAARHAGFLGDLDVYTRDELDREPVFTEFLRPRGIGWGAATAIQVPNGDTLVFDVERRIETGPVDRQTVRRLDALRPHLARAGMISARLGLERVRAAAMALDLIGLPAAVLAGSMRMLAANPKLEAMMPHIVLDRRDRVALADGKADALLAEALARLAYTDDAGCVRSIPISASENGPPAIVHLVPIRRAAHEVFSNASAILVFTPIVPAEVPTADVLQGLFDLTPAEARVARSVAELQTIEAIAAALGVSRETVRTQLKAVLAKTGTRRQGDLAALLAGSRFLQE